MIVTNLVVALMIVSNVRERCDAVAVHKQFNPALYSWITFSDASVETMWREKAFTNFVYSTRIETEKILVRCPRCENDTNCFQAGDFYGKPINCIFFDEIPWRECEKCRDAQVRRGCDD